MYSFFLDRMQLPIAPEKMTMKIKNQNKTCNLVSGTEINILKEAGLTEVSFSVLLPNQIYPFAIYPSGFQPAEVYLTHIKSLKTRKKPFRFIVSRVAPSGGLLFDTNMLMSLEDYSITENAKNGFDVVVEVKLKQYIPYSTKIINIVEEEKQPRIIVETVRDTVEKPEAPKTYTVVKGDSLWSIAQKQMGNGSRYPELYEANKSTIDAGNKGTGNPRYTIYPKQLLTIP